MASQGRCAFRTGDGNFWDTAVLPVAVTVVGLVLFLVLCHDDSAYDWARAGDSSCLKKISGLHSSHSLCPWFLSFHVR